MKKQLVLLCLFLLLSVTGVLGVSRFYEPDYGYGYAGFGSLSMYFNMFLDFLEQNEYLVDAIVFLVIFLIVSKKVFSSFTEEKSLYVVIGIALTIGIIMYERRTGFSLVVNSGYLSVLVLLGLVMFVISTTKKTGFRLLTLSILGFVLIYYVLNRFPYIAYALSPIMGLLILGLIAMLIYAFTKFFLEAGEADWPKKVKETLEKFGIGKGP